MLISLFFSAFVLDFGVINIWPPKPSAKEVTPQWLLQDWPGLAVPNLVSRAGSPGPLASQHCMLKPGLPAKIYSWEPSQQPCEIILSGEGDRCRTKDGAKLFSYHLQLHVEIILQCMTM